jgi:hypothetical protein
MEPLDQRRPSRHRQQHNWLTITRQISPCWRTPAFMEQIWRLSSSTTSNQVEEARKISQ